jgi:hypothetical protein
MLPVRVATGFNPWRARAIDHNPVSPPPHVPRMVVPPVADAVPVPIAVAAVADSVPVYVMVPPVADSVAVHIVPVAADVVPHHPSRHDPARRGPARGASGGPRAHTGLLPAPSMRGCPARRVGLRWRQRKQERARQERAQGRADQALSNCCLIHYYKRPCGESIDSSRRDFARRQGASTRRPPRLTLDCGRLARLIAARAGIRKTSRPTAFELRAGFFQHLIVTGIAYPAYSHPRV